MTSKILTPVVNLPGTWFHRWIYYLAAGFIFAAVVLRSLIIFRDSALLRPILLVLAAGLLSFVAASMLYPRLPAFTLFLIILQAALILLLLLQTKTDYFAILFVITGMQAMQQLPPRFGWAVVGLGFVLTFTTLLGPSGLFQALALAVGITALGVFVAAFLLASKQAQKAQKENQSLARELEGANRQLQDLVKQQEQLAGVHERQFLARELHDSITQTIFSMNLTTQSALLLLERNPVGVAEQMNRLDQLARSALGEIQLLISRLSPDKGIAEGLEAALRKHLADRLRLENLSVDLQVQGSQPLGSREEQSLFHIAQEALNNIVKHAGVNQASIRLNLQGQSWLEIEDQGRGFDCRQAGVSGRLGLAGMRERALEIGWTLSVDSSPGMGTRIRVQKE
jgi:signal transduction histidine kinase